MRGGGLSSKTKKRLLLSDLNRVRIRRDACRHHSQLVYNTQDAVLLARRGDHVGAAAAISLLLETAARKNVTHPELFVCLSNRAARYRGTVRSEPLFDTDLFECSLLALGLHANALADLRRASELIQAAMPG